MKDQQEINSENIAEIETLVRGRGGIVSTAKRIVKILMHTSDISGLHYTDMQKCIRRVERLIREEHFFNNAVIGKRTPLNDCMHVLNTLRHEWNGVMMFMSYSDNSES